MHSQQHIDNLLWYGECKLLPGFALFSALGLTCLALVRSSRTAFTAFAMSCRPCRVNGMQVSICCMTLLPMVRGKLCIWHDQSLACI